jgi:hypothetical protein
MKATRIVVKQCYGDDTPNRWNHYLANKIFQYTPQTIFRYNDFYRGNSFVEYDFFWGEHEHECNVVENEQNP